VIVLGIAVGRPSDDELLNHLAQASGEGFNYDHVGSTLDPSGRRRPTHECHQLSVGSGEADFARAAAGLRAWVPQRALGARVIPEGAPLEEGADVLVALPIGPAMVLAPDRIVGVVDEPARFGFAYGSLAGHPEAGEESFVVERRGDGEVRFTICVDAVPGTLPARLAAPVVRIGQRRALRTYLRSIGDHVAGSRPS
jgi:uncharacterized protein (UPF0548 family)